MNWDDIRLFLAAAEEGSFRRAALQLNIGHATLSRRIESLETALNVKLFNRLTTGLKLTEAGKELLITASNIGEMLQDQSSRIYGSDQLVKGKITLTLPEIFSNYIVLPALAEFQEAWPGVVIEIITSFDVLDLNTQEADIAIRNTNTPDEQLIGRHLGTMFQAAYASQDYILEFKKHKKRNFPHNWIRPGESSTIGPVLFDDISSELPIESNIIISNIDGQLNLAKSSRGIVTLPCLIGDQEDQLVCVGPPCPSDG